MRGRLSRYGLEMAAGLAIGLALSVSGWGPAAAGEPARPSDPAPRTLLDMAEGSRPAPPGSPPQAVPAPVTAEPSNPSQIFAAGLDAIARGDPLEARRQFERLIARAPDGPIAERARRELAVLYANPVPASVAPPTPPSYLGAPRDPGAAPLAPSPASASTPARQPWSVEVKDTRRALKPLQEQMLYLSGDRVFFSAGSVDLGGGARTVLHGQAGFLRDHPDLKVLVTGHADEPGSREANMSLSSARADAVRRALEADGVAPQRIATAARGSDEPVAPCPDPACAAQNRRAVTEIVGEISTPPR